MGFNRSRLLELIHSAREALARQSANINVPAITQELLKDERIRKAYADCPMELDTKVLVMLLSLGDDVQADVESWLTALDHTLRNPPNWVVVAGLVNVSTSSPLTVGRVSIEPKTEKRFGELASSCVSGDLPSNWKDCFERIETEAILIAHVQAPNETLARRQADALFRETVACVRFFAFLDGYTEPIGLQGTVAQPGPTFIAAISEHLERQDIRMVTVSMSADNKRGKAPLNLQEAAWTTSERFRSVKDVLSKDISIRTELEKRFLRAMHWFGEALVEPDKTDAFLKFCIALEALLGQSDLLSNIATPMAEKAAFALGRTTAERIQIFNEVKKLYGRRSRIVHGSLDVSGDSLETAKMKTIVAGLLQAFVDNNWMSIFSHWSQFANWFDERRFSEPS